MISPDTFARGFRSPNFGRFESALLKLVARPAVISGIEVLGTRFLLMSLAGDALQRVAWLVGDKVQIQLGGFVSRTYTPLSWDSESGETQVLIYMHGADPQTTPGASWADAALCGDPCLMFGPRPSLNLLECNRNAVFFGDETSFGTAAALSTMAGWMPSVSFVFEVSEPDACRPVLQALGLHDVVLVTRTPDGTHLQDVDEHVHRLAAVTGAGDFILTGQASSIQHLTRKLKQRGRSSADLLTKVHWSVNKSGLD